MYRTIIVCTFSQWHIQGRALQGPDPSKCLPLKLKGLRYSNRTVKYSNKAVSRLGCALPNLSSLAFQVMLKCACLDKYFMSKQRCYEEEKIAIVVTLLKEL